jgi:tetratricopeptide (TPR) repeat protein
MHPRFDLGIHRFLSRQYEEAAGAFRDVLREDPNDAAAWSFYGMALAHLGRGADAEAALSRAVALAPQNEEAWFHLGVARSLREEWNDAASAYRRAVALAPEDVVAWHRLGVALAESGDEPGAAVAFERALVLSREVPSADKGRPPQSPHRLDDHTDEAGVREGAREAKSWLDLALSLLSLGEQEEAVAAYERAYTLDPARARASLFRPMLRLVTAVGEEAGPIAPGRPGPPVRPAGVTPPPRPEVS